MPLRPNDFAARDGGRIDFRSDALRVRVDLGDLVCADGHDLLCAFEFSTRVGEQAADRQLFRELLMADRLAVTRDDVAVHFRLLLQISARTAVAQPIASVLSDAGKGALEQILRNALNAAAFNAGLIILPPFQLELSSPSLQRQQQEAAQRARTEERAAGRLDHLRRATELLKQFDFIRAAAPSISAGQVLERIAPADRGALLEAILAGNAASARALYAVAGTALVRIDPASDPIQMVLIELPTTLGPLRSAQPVNLDGEPRLLVGARGGVLLVDPREPKAAVAYAEPELNSSLGFNRAVLLPESNSIVATHGEAGLVRWERGNPAAPASRIRASELAPQGSGPVRNVHALDSGALLCSVGNVVTVLHGSDRRVLPTESSVPIINIVTAGDRLFVIHEDGSVASIDRNRLEMLRRDSYGGEICAAGGLPWLDGVRLLLACTSGPVDCVGPDDSLVTRFNSVYRGFRNITASASCVAAVSPDRQRLILWNSWEGRAPAHDLHVTSIARHRIADIAFA
jgi:hypothetical protein